MKNAWLYGALFLVLLMGAGCTAHGETPVEAEQNTAVVHDIVQDFAYAGVKQLSDEASLIVVGILLAETPLGDGNSLYTLAVEETLRGEPRYVAEVYAFSGLLEQNARYLLFLQERDSVFYEKPMVAMVDIASIIRAYEDGSLALPKAFTESYASLQKLKDAVYALEPPERANIEPVIDTLDTNALIEKSDAIFSAKVTSLHYANANAAGDATLALIARYKGEADDVLMCSVPQGLSEGQSYLFFRSDGINSMPSRQNSIVPLGQKETDALIELLGNEATAK